MVTYLDFIRKIECVIVSSVREDDAVESIGQAIGCR